MKLSIMQGRLQREPVGGALNYCHEAWQEELPLLKKLDIKYLEWVIDWRCQSLNPLFVDDEVETTLLLEDIKLSGLVMNNFVKDPLISSKSSLKSIKARLNTYILFAEKLRISSICIPFVIENNLEFTDIKKSIAELLEMESDLIKRNVFLSLELELPIKKLQNIRDMLENSLNIGFTFDTGNSRVQGNNPVEEIELYGSNLFNVHIKDRTVNGERVPLGEGDVDFNLISHKLSSINFSGFLILETAWTKLNPATQMSFYLEFCRNLGWAN